MTPLGKPLVFYLKYMAEMNHLCYPEHHGGEPDLTGMEDSEQVREMARFIGDAACEKVADFLELCGRRIEDHFTSLKIGTLNNKKTRGSVKKYWSWGTTVHVSSVPDGSFWCGVFIDAPPNVTIPMEDETRGAVVPYLWSKGGRTGEDAVWNILGGWSHSRSGEGLVKESGEVALACIPIKAHPPESFDVDRDPLIAEVMKVIARIGAKETEAIAKFVAGSKNQIKTESSTVQFKDTTLDS